MPTGGTCPHRARNQAFVTTWYANHGIPVVLGRDATGRRLWSRARAINAAARDAHQQHPNRDVFIIADNDLIPDHSTFWSALQAVDEHAMTLPFALTRYLTPSATEALLRGRTRAALLGSTRPIGSRSYAIVRKSVFVSVNGLDEAFEGWGPEDRAFLHSVRAQVGTPLELDGVRTHLWHPVSPSRRDAQNLARLRARSRAYMNADRDTARALAREYGSLNLEVRMRPADAPDQALGTLELLVSTLARARVTAWVTDGTLLGFVRDGGFIPHDHDLDVGAMITEYRPDVLAALTNAGFRVSKTLGTRESGLQHKLERDGFKLDIFWHYDNPGGGVWHAAHDRRGPIHYTYDRLRLAPLTIAGRTFWAPTPPKLHLAQKYGPEWRTPVTDWDWADGPANAIRPA